MADLIVVLDGFGAQLAEAGAFAHERLQRVPDAGDDARIRAARIMDVHTAAAIERLSDGIAGLEQSSRREMAESRGDMTGLRGEMTGLRGEVTELRGDLSELRGEVTELRGELREGLAENRRHAGVLFESLRGDIRVLAEGFAAVSTKLDSLQR